MTGIRKIRRTGFCGVSPSAEHELAGHDFRFEEAAKSGTSEFDDLVTERLRLSWSVVLLPDEGRRSFDGTRPSLTAQTMEGQDRRTGNHPHRTLELLQRMSVGEKMHRVVVTGVGVVAPNGIGRREFSEAIFEGRSGVDYIESFDTSGLSIKIAGEVKNFDVLPYLGEHKKNLKLMSRAVRFAVGAAAMAVEDAGLETSRLDPGRFGVCMGTGITPVDVGELVDPIMRERGHGRRVRHGPVRDGPGRVDLSALAAAASAQHGGGAHLDPPSRDGPEQHDRDGVRGRDAGGGRGVSTDRPGRCRRDAGRADATAGSIPSSSWPTPP